MLADPADADAPVTFGAPSINAAPVAYDYGTAPTGTVVQVLIGGGSNGTDPILRARCLDSNGEKVEATVRMKVRDTP
jgi:NAD(P)H-hydrate repair Nnr-like enzyme with NAD(P)H-hydrate epimerase domain